MQIVNTDILSLTGSNPENLGPAGLADNDKLVEFNDTPSIQDLKGVEDFITLLKNWLSSSEDKKEVGHDQNATAEKYGIVPNTFLSPELLVSLLTFIPQVPGNNVIPQELDQNIMIPEIAIRQNNAQKIWDKLLVLLNEQSTGTNTVTINNVGKETQFLSTTADNILLPSIPVNRIESFSLKEAILELTSVIESAETNLAAGKQLNSTVAIQPEAGLSQDSLLSLTAADVFPMVTGVNEDNLPAILENANLINIQPQDSTNRSKDQDGSGVASQGEQLYSNRLFEKDLAFKPATSPDSDLSPAREKIGMVYGENSLLNLRPQAQAPLQLEQVSANPAPGDIKPFDFLNQIIQNIHTNIKEKIQEAHIQLKPEYLGRAMIKIEVKDSFVSIRIEVTNPAVREALEANFSGLRDSLKEQGFTVDHFSVTVNTDTAGYYNSQKEQLPQPSASLSVRGLDYTQEYETLEPAANTVSAAVDYLFGSSINYLA